MSKEICRHPNSENNYLERLKQERQAKRIIDIVFKSGDLEKLDEIPIETKISMTPRKKEFDYEKIRKAKYYSWSENSFNDIILANG